MQTSTFGLNFMAMRQVVDMIQTLRNKVRQFRVLLVGETNMHCDNEVVYKKTFQPDSAIKKKYPSDAYYMYRSAVASGMIRWLRKGLKRKLQISITPPLSAPRR